jgi:hypothetical protein
MIQSSPGPASNLRLQITASCRAESSEVSQKPSHVLENGSENVHKYRRMGGEN